MDATSTQNNLKNNFSSLLADLRKKHLEVSFVEAESFYWSGDESTIFYDPTSEMPEWSLLHEVGHMLNGDKSYKSDAELIKMEVLAWEKARHIAKEDYEAEIDYEYIQECIDSYRNWQYARSKCPVCSQTGLEKEFCRYRCINCQKEWDVSKGRFCRAYRKTKNLR